MRSGLAVLIVLAATSAAAAHSTSSPVLPAQGDAASDSAAPRIDLSSADSFLYRHVRSTDSENLTLDNPHVPAAPEGASGPSLHIGSFHAEIGGTGAHAHLAHYTLQGVRVMGGTVSGSIDGRSAQLSIRW